VESLDGILSSSNFRLPIWCQKLKVTNRTIKSRLAEWGIQKQNHTASADKVLQAPIRVLFYQVGPVGLEENEMLRVLQYEGFEIEAGTL
jgi:hypothetical protein